MYIVPTADDFVNDFFSVAVTSDYFITFNVVDELYEQTGREVTIKQFNVVAELVSDTGKVQINCPSRIGLSNDLISIVTDNEELNGVAISMDNLGQWGVEINE